MKRAFTLLELSVVLVIIGLLIGAVLVGQSLTRSARLRNLVSDTQQYQVAFKAFQEKYSALPGDMTDATRYWGTDPDGCPTHTNRVPKTATCNGNGDGMIAINGSETFRVWQHLADAGFISGLYSGVVGPAYAGDHDPGINCPVLKKGKDAGISIGDFNYKAPGDLDYMFEGTYDNSLSFGKCGGWDCVHAFLTPSETWNIDTKLDDGKPGLGKIVTRTSTTASGGTPGCSTATTSVGTVAQTATYILDNPKVACGFYYRDLF